MKTRQERIEDLLIAQQRVQEAEDEVYQARHQLSEVFSQIHANMPLGMPDDSRIGLGCSIEQVYRELRKQVVLQLAQDGNTRAFGIVIKQLNRAADIHREVWRLEEAKQGQEEERDRLVEELVDAVTG